MKVLFILLSLCQPAWSLEVAFFGSSYDRTFQGRFYHTALGLNDGTWLHAYPMKGVKQEKNLSSIGAPDIILKSPTEIEIPESELKKQIGKNFDASYNWQSKTGTHCTKLIADLLRIPPLQKPIEPYLGLSPEELFKELIKRKWKPKTRF